MWALMNVDITTQAAEAHGGNKEKLSCTVNPASLAYVINQQENKIGILLPALLD